MRKASLAIVTVIGLSHSTAAIAIPWSEQHAWCVTKTQSIYNTAYRNTKLYNNCIKTAEQQIRQYEKRQREWELGAPERARQEREAEERKKRREMEEARQWALEEERKLKQQKAENDDFFDSF